MKQKKNLCHAGDVIIHQGKRMEVAQAICAGREDQPRKGGGVAVGHKSIISACRIMEDNGQVLRRSPRYVGDDWELDKSYKKARWAKKYICCVSCGTTERKHQAKGMCRKCYRRQYAN